VRRGIFEYDLRHTYRGPEGFIDLPEDRVKRQRAIDEALLAHPQLDDLQSGVVLDVKPKEMQVMIATGDIVVLKGDSLKLASASITDSTQPKKRLRPGAIVRLLSDGGVWKLAQLPQVEAAFVSMNADTGAILSLVGGWKLCITSTHIGLLNLLLLRIHSELFFKGIEFITLRRDVWFLFIVGRVHLHESCIIRLLKKTLHSFIFA
jgi:hypothetical protein